MPQPTGELWKSYVPLTITLAARTTGYRLLQMCNTLLNQGKSVVSPERRLLRAQTAHTCPNPRYTFLGKPGRAFWL